MAQDLCFWNDFELKKPPLVTIEVENTVFGRFKYMKIKPHFEY